MEKDNKDDKNFWFDIRSVLPYQAIFNFIVSNRGCGKTYSTKKFFIKKYKEKGYKFVFVQRSNNDLSDIAPDFFDDMVDEKMDIIFVKNTFYIGFPAPKGLGLEEKGKKPYGKEKIEQTTTQTIEGVEITEKIRGRPDFIYHEFGRSVALRTPIKLKGKPFDDKFKYVLFDEFIPIDRNGWLHDELKRIAHITETVFRMRKPCWFFLANAEHDDYLEILAQLGCEKTDNFEADKIYRMKNKEVLVYFPSNPAYQKAKAATPFGKLMQGTDWFKQMVLNVAARREFEEFVGVDTENYYPPIFYIKDAEGNYYGMRKHIVRDRYAVVKVNKMPTTKYLYSLAKDDLTTPMWQPRTEVFDAIANLRLRFDTVGTAKTFWDFFQKIV